MGGGAQDSEDAITGINVTPLVDVTLVLLIIFMVTAKLMDSKGLTMDLPKSASSSEIQTVFSVSLTADAVTQVDGKTVPNDDAVLALAKAARDKNPDLRAVIKADVAVSHGRVMHVLELLKQAQVAKIAFATQPATAAPLTPVK